MKSTRPPPPNYLLYTFTAVSAFLDEAGSAFFFPSTLAELCIHAASCAVCYRPPPTTIWIRYSAAVCCYASIIVGFLLYIPVVRSMAYPWWVHISVGYTAVAKFYFALRRSIVHLPVRTMK